MTTFVVIVTKTVRVTLDDTKFTPEFFAEFNGSIKDWGTDLEHHAQHIAWLESTDRLDSFTEGYGEIKDMGISASVVDTETEIASHV